LYPVAEMRHSATAKSDCSAGEIAEAVHQHWIAEVEAKKCLGDPSLKKGLLIREKK